MKDTKISWATHTFNPWIGCTKISAGCANCYAEKLNDRMGWTQWGRGRPRYRTSEKTWNEVGLWNRQARDAARASNLNLAGDDDELHDERPRVFTASLADVFDPEVPDAWRDDLFNLIYRCQHLDFLILTKRPKEAGEYLLGSCGAGAVNFDEAGCFRNVWLGTSVENQGAADMRVFELLRIPAICRFLSCEPLLGPVEIRPEWLKKLDWLIVGGESGPAHRPMDVGWARSLYRQCRDWKIPFFMKQLGGHPDKRERIEEFPEDLRVQEFPKV